MISIRKQFGFRFVLLLFSFVFLSTPFPAQAETIPVSRLANVLKSFNALSGSFQQENLDALQDRKTHASGRFYYMKPGLMKWIYTTPDPYTIIVGKQRIWIYDPILENVTIHDASKVKGLNALVPIFEPLKLQQYYRSSKPARSFLDIRPGDRTAYLNLRQPDPNMAEIQIAINSDFQIRQFVVLDRNGNYRKITFDALDTKPGLKRSDFDFVVPEGVEIIDKTKEKP